MPTREEVRIQMLHEFTARGLHPSDPSYAFALQALGDMNEGMADLDDELADIAARLRWLAQAPTWLNQRKPEEFDAFVVAKLAECETVLAQIRQRWEQHRCEAASARWRSPEPDEPPRA